MIKKLMGDMVLVIETDPGDTTKSGIFVGDSMRKNRSVLFGTVRKVGPGQLSPLTDKLIPTTLKEGDLVIYPRGAGIHIGKLQGVNNTLLQEVSILAKVIE